MATTVNNAFDNFNKNFVNLDSDRTKAARGSRKWLLGQLESLPGKIADFPRLYTDRHVQHGSFARNTKIRPLDDIDMILAFTADHTKYSIHNYGLSYSLTVPEEAVNLRKLCNDDGTLNSIKLINKIVKSLDTIDQYKAADIKRDGEAATLNLQSYEWVYDIVPALYTDTGYYLIPDGGGGWKATDPRIDQQRVNNIHASNGKNVLQLIRTLKYWNRRIKATTISPYLFENIILNFCESNVLADYIDYNVKNFWNYLRSAIYSSVPDPKKFQGDLNNLSMADKNAISAKAEDAYKKALEAYHFEMTDKDQQKAINKWREIFGNDFPKYE